MTEHRFNLRVYYEDTDMAGVVYHANILRFFERGRTEWLRALGVQQSELWQKSAIGFAVSKAEVKWLKPLYLDDALEVRTQLENLGRASLSLRQELWRADGLVGQLAVTIACIDQQGRATRLPDDLRQKIMN